MAEKFKVQFLEDAVQFLDSLEEKARDKIIYNVTKAKFTNDKELFKKLKGEIWEFRTLYNKTHYRLFAFWDHTAKSKTIVLATHGLIKKTDKTPQGDIEKAERIRKRYFELKTSEDEN
ncbi:MAG TPA: type II toxin-antitoxin system RelE/ParE family toxin [Prolixibacteraceae bacterium]|nr:type II toxin-antitoxin system RelE/ParE family toxin [Prolixibacteraceae bacterium]